MGHPGLVEKLGSLRASLRAGGDDIASGSIESCYQYPTHITLLMILPETLLLIARAIVCGVETQSNADDGSSKLWQFEYGSNCLGDAVASSLSSRGSLWGSADDRLLPLLSQRGVPCSLEFRDDPSAES